MDEVDKIIVHSLRRIGCNVDDGQGMGTFTPEQLVAAVVRCVQQIRPEASLPRTTLPTENMAQRFSVASTLAELCAACGYRNDIGYQTFLYPSAVEVRRLFMFLIEQLPKSAQPSVEEVSVRPIGEYAMLRREIKEKMRRELHAPWVPQYARGIGNRKHNGCSSHIVPFAPQLNLNVPPAGEVAAPELLAYLQQQAPTVFQQTAGADCDLISSVLHKNATDLWRPQTGDDCPQVFRSAKANADGPPSTIAKAKPLPIGPKPGTGPTTEGVALSKQTPLEKLNDQVNALRTRNDEKIAERKATSAKITHLKSQQLAVQAELKELVRLRKMHERTCMVLDTSPHDNLHKLEALIATTRERRTKLEAQWQEYRRSMLDQLSALRGSQQAKTANDVGELRKTIAALEAVLRERSARHATLAGELKRLVEGESIAPRKEYTRRIMEFIGNIRKQRHDIYKVLDDARDLQKQLNAVEGQLHRQFNYTDDLLFQSAKHDIHAKQAYKLLALLHTTCGELVELVARTGSLTKEIRDLEVNIDTEKLKNFDTSLKQITDDIANFDSIIQTVQAEIRQVEKASV